MKKRIVSVALVLIMLLSIVPMGMIPASAATSYIDRVAISIDVPVDGVPLKTEAVINTYCDKLGGMYPVNASGVTVVSVSWYKKNTSTPLANGTKATLGQTYVVTILVSAESGYAFENDMTAYDNRINGKSASEMKYTSGSTVYWAFSVEYTAIAAVSGAPVVSIKNMQLSPYEGEPMEVEISATGTNVKYQWQICYGDKSEDSGGINWGSAVAIEDNARYKGCKTSHFKINTYFGDTFDEELSFCLIRCKVTSDSGTSYSQEFWYVLVDRTVVSSISLNGVVAPVSGNLPSKTINENAAEYSVSGVEWYYADSDGTMTKMIDNEVFVYGDYVCRIHITPEREYKFDGNTTVTVNGISRTLTTVSGADLNPLGADRYYVDVPYTVDEISNSILGFKNLSPTPNTTDWADGYSELGEIEYCTTAVFGFVPKPLSDELVDAGYTIEERVYLNRTGKGTILTRHTGAQFDAMGYIDVMGDYQVWCQMLLFKDGEYVTGDTHIYDFSVVNSVIDYASVTVPKPEINTAPDIDIGNATVGSEGYDVTGIEWSYYDESSGYYTLMDNNELFKEGGKYLCTISIEAFDGYAFPADKTKLTAKVNGQSVSVFQNNSPTQALLRYFVELKAPEKITDKIDITFDKPVAKETVDTTIEVLNDKVYVGAVEWYKYGYSNPVSDNHICVENVEYFVAIELYAADGYTFGDISDSEWKEELLSNITFNGEAMLASLSSSSSMLIIASPVYKATSGLLGDVNNDTKVDSIDYLLVKRSCFKTYELDSNQLERADINGDEAIDSTDYLLIKRIAFGTYKVQ